MTWLAWRQHRQQALFGALSFALLAVFLLLTGRHMHSVFGSSGLSHCLATRNHGDCGELESAFETRFGTLRQLAPFLMVLPGLVGLFWGAPLLARELEHGTHRLVWTQGVGRLRWLTAKLAFVFGATLAFAFAFAALITWWLGPLNQSTGSRFQPGIFDQQGIVPVAYTLFALALGVAAGAILGRTLPAMAATLVGFVAPRLAVGTFLRRHFDSPVTMRLAPLPGVDLNYPGAWVLHSYTLDGHGRHVSLFEAAATCNGKGGSARGLAACVHRHGFVNVAVLQPASRFWLFQGIEAALYGVAALALLALTVYWVDRRVS
jgi:hypothetical protein